MRKIKGITHQPSEYLSTDTIPALDRFVPASTLYALLKKRNSVKPDSPLGRSLSASYSELVEKLLASEPLPPNVSVSSREAQNADEDLRTYGNHQSQSKNTTLRELITNASDAYHPEGEKTGRFGVGFLQVLSWLEHDDDSITVTTKHKRDEAISLIIKNIDGKVHVALRPEPDRTEVGTTISVYLSNPLTKDEVSRLESDTRDSLKNYGAATVRLNHEVINKPSGYESLNGVEIKRESYPVEVFLSEHGFVVSDAGRGMTSDSILFNLLVPKKRGGNELATVPKNSELPSLVFLEGNSLYKDNSVVRLEVGGVLVETLHCSGLNLPDETVINLPSATRLTESRNAIFPEEVTRSAIRTLIDTVVAAEDPRKFQVMNALAAVCINLDHRPGAAGDLTAYLYRQTPNVIDVRNAVYLPNEKDMLLVDPAFADRPIVYLNRKIYASDFTTTHLVRCNTFRSSNYELFLAPLKREEDTDPLYIVTGQTIILDKDTYEKYADEPSLLDALLNFQISYEFGTIRSHENKGYFVRNRLLVPQTEQPADSATVASASLVTFLRDSNHEAIANVLTISAQSSDLLTRSLIAIKYLEALPENIHDDTDVLQEIGKLFEVTPLTSWDRLFDHIDGLIELHVRRSRGFLGEYDSPPKSGALDGLRSRLEILKHEGALSSNLDGEVVRLLVSAANRMGVKSIPLELLYKSLTVPTPDDSVEISTFASDTSTSDYIEGTICFDLVETSKGLALRGLPRGRFMFHYTNGKDHLIEAEEDPVVVHLFNNEWHETAPGKFCKLFQYDFTSERGSLSDRALLWVGDIRKGPQTLMELVDGKLSEVKTRNGEAIAFQDPKDIEGFAPVNGFNIVAVQLDRPNGVLAERDGELFIFDIHLPGSSYQDLVADLADSTGLFQDIARNALVSIESDGSINNVIPGTYRFVRMDVGPKHFFLVSEDVDGPTQIGILRDGTIDYKTLNLVTTWDRLKFCVGDLPILEVPDSGDRFTLYALHTDGSITLLERSVRIFMGGQRIRGGVLYNTADGPLVFSKDESGNVVRGLYGVPNAQISQIQETRNLLMVTSDNPRVPRFYHYNGERFVLVEIEGAPYEDLTEIERLTSGNGMPSGYFTITLRGYADHPKALPSYPPQLLVREVSEGIEILDCSELHPDTIFYQGCVGFFISTKGDLLRAQDGIIKYVCNIGKPRTTLEVRKFEEFTGVTLLSDDTDRRVLTFLRVYSDRVVTQRMRFDSTIRSVERQVIFGQEVLAVNDGNQTKYFQLIGDHLESSDVGLLLRDSPLSGTNPYRAVASRENAVQFVSARTDSFSGSKGKLFRAEYEPLLTSLLQEFGFNVNQDAQLARTFFVRAWHFNPDLFREDLPFRASLLFYTSHEIAERFSAKQLRALQRIAEESPDGLSSFMNFLNNIEPLLDFAAKFDHYFDRWMNLYNYSKESALNIGRSLEARYSILFDDWEEESTGYAFMFHPALREKAPPALRPYLLYLTAPKSELLKRGRIDLKCGEDVAHVDEMSLGTMVGMLSLADPDRVRAITLLAEVNEISTEFRTSIEDKNADEEIIKTVVGQDGSGYIWIRELIQNSRDATRRTDVQQEASIRTFQNQRRSIACTISDSVGMSLGEVLGLVLIPDRTEKRDQAEATGFFGQGFYSVFQDANEVYLKTSKGDGLINIVEFKCNYDKIDGLNVLKRIDVQVRQGHGKFKGTEITRVKHASHAAIPALEATLIASAAQTFVGAIDPREFVVSYNGAAVNDAVSVLAVVDTPHGTLTLATQYDAVSRLTKDSLYVSALEHAELGSLVPDFIWEGLLRVGVSLDLPRSVKLTRTRNALINERSLSSELAPYVAHIFLQAGVKLFVERDLDIPGLPRDYLYKERYEHEVPASVIRDAEACNQSLPQTVDFERYRGLENRYALVQLLTQIKAALIVDDEAQMISLSELKERLLDSTPMSDPAGSSFSESFQHAVTFALMNLKRESLDAQVGADADAHREALKAGGTVEYLRFTESLLQAIDPRITVDSYFAEVARLCDFKLPRGLVANLYHGKALGIPAFNRLLEGAATLQDRDHFLYAWMEAWIHEVTHFYDSRWTHQEDTEMPQSFRTLMQQRMNAFLTNHRSGFVDAAIRTVRHSE